MKRPALRLRGRRHDRERGASVMRSTGRSGGACLAVAVPLTSAAGVVVSETDRPVYSTTREPRRRVDHASGERRCGRQDGDPGRGHPPADRFGDASGFGKISGEYFTLSAGVDTTPLFQGLEGNLCQCPHWGFVLRGQLTTTDANGAQETVKRERPVLLAARAQREGRRRRGDRHVQPAARAQPRHRPHDRRR